MGAQRLGDNLLDLHAGIERCVRVLEDHLRSPAERLQLPAGERREILPVEQNAAFLGLVQTQEGASHGRLPATGLPHEGQRLAPLDVEAHLVDGAQPL